MAIDRRDAPTMARIVCLFLAGVSQAPAGAEPVERSVKEIAKTARSSVVVIDAARRDGESTGLGTGFVVRSDGVIATNLTSLGRRAGLGYDSPMTTSPTMPRPCWPMIDIGISP